MDNFDKEHDIKEYLGINDPDANLNISGPDQIPGILNDITSFSGKNMRLEVIRASETQDLQAILYSLYGRLSDMGYKIFLYRGIPEDYKATKGKGVIFLYEDYIDLKDPSIVSKLKDLLSGRSKIRGKGVTIVLGLTIGTYALLSESREQTNDGLLTGDLSHMKTTLDEETRVLGSGLVLLSIPMIITWFGIVSGLYTLLADDFLRWFIFLDTVVGLSLVLFESFRNSFQKSQFLYAAGLLFIFINIAAYLVRPSYSISNYFSNSNFPLYFVTSVSNFIFILKILANFEIITTAIVMIFLILPFLKKKTYFLILGAIASTALSIISDMLLQTLSFQIAGRNIRRQLLFSSKNLYPFFTTTTFHLIPYFAISINGYVYYYPTVLPFLVFVFAILSNLFFSVIYFSTGIRMISEDSLI